MSIFKSEQEEPWQRFEKTMGPVLDKASRRFRGQYGRTLAMGGATRLATAEGDVIRFPIEVRGGDREYAVATVLLSGSARRFYDKGRLEQIARAAVQAAEQYHLEPPAKPGDLVLTYP